MENSSTVACLPHTATEPLFNQQELHTLFHPHAWLNPSSREEKPSDTVPCSGFGFVNTSNCAGIGITQHFSTDVDSRSWIDKSSPHGLSKDPDPLFFLTDWKPLLSHGQIPKESCVQQAMAALASNESVNAAVSANASVEMAQILDNWGSFTQNVSLTANSAKGGLLINGDVHVPAPSMDPELGKRIAKLSCLSMQAISTPSSQLPQVVANPLWGHRGKLDPIPSQLNKAGSPDNLTSMPTSLYTHDQPICMSTTIANGCHTGLEGKVMLQTVMMSPSMHATSQIKEEHVSMDMSDANFGQEASSVCDTSGGGETSTERVNKGKNKRVKDQPKVDAAQVVNVKNAGTMDESKEGKRRKCGGNTSEEDQKVDSGDSMPSSCKESSKHAEPSKLDYIHVRARRGQATDSHSLAERVRREKISKRMKFLQDLVPGCSKITGKALMLDEIINYVQSLQRQVEFLSMKLACISPMLDFQMDGHFGREIIRPHAMDHKALMMSEESTNSYSPYLHLPQPACTSQLIIRPSPLVNACSLGGSGTAGRETMSTPFVSMDSYGDAVSQLTQFRGEELQHVLQGRRAPSTSSSLQGQALYNGKTEIGL